MKTSDNSKIITASFDKSIVVSETDSFKLLSKTSDAHTDIIHSIAIPDTKSTNILTSAGNDGIVSIWDLRALKDSNASQTCKLKTKREIESQTIYVGTFCQSFAPKV